MSRCVARHDYQQGYFKMTFLVVHKQLFKNPFKLQACMQGRGGGGGGGAGGQQQLHCSSLGCEDMPCIGMGYTIINVAA